MALLALSVSGCTEDAGPPGGSAVTTIAYLFDGSPADAELVTAPPLAGLELAARRTGEASLEIEPVNLGLERGEVMAALRAVSDDRGVVAAVVAPWTAPPSGAIELLAERGLPVVTLSWAWGPPEGGEGRWLSLAVGRAHEAVMLLSEAADLAPNAAAAVCLAGDEHVTSRALLETVADLGRATGSPETVVAGIAAVSQPAQVDAVATRIADAGCPVLVWTGGTTGATSVLSSFPDRPPTVVGGSRIKTDAGLALAASGVEVVTVCACVDVSLTMDPERQRFVHDLQAESGAAPGPFAVEAYDAGRLLGGLVGDIGSDDPRRALAAALEDLTGFRGLDGAYTFERDGSRGPEDVETGRWRAAGSRWLPAEGAA